MELHKCSLAGVAVRCWSPKRLVVSSQVPKKRRTLRSFSRKLEFLMPTEKKVLLVSVLLRRCFVAELHECSRGSGSPARALREGEGRGPPRAKALGHFAQGQCPGTGRTCTGPRRGAGVRAWP